MQAAAPPHPIAATTVTLQNVKPIIVKPSVMPE